jgi:hypothetical protein
VVHGLDWWRFGNPSPSRDELNMVRIVGLDVSRSTVSACLLEARPDRVREWFREHRGDIPSFSADRAGLDALMALQPEVAILEPSGIHYSIFWAENLHNAGVLLLWVGHAQLKSYRVGLRLPSKNDPADAMALCCYGHQHLTEPDYFLDFDHTGPSHRLRSLSLQIRHYERLSVPLKNRLRQQLAHEFPEVAQTKTSGSLWAFIAGQPTTKRMQTIYSKKLASSVGTGIGDFSRFHAAQLWNLEQQITLYELELFRMMEEPEFEIYRRVFNRFQFGGRVQAFILSHIFPIQTHLGPEGKPIIETVKGKGGKPSKRYRSLNSFKLSLGFGLVEDTSGQSERWIPGGSSLCRSALWQWVFTCVEVKSKRKPYGITETLGLYCDQLKTNGIPAPLVRSRVARKAVEMLFHDLVREIRG